MAGRVRHPIDVGALEAYLAQYVPEIQTPLDVKQFGYGQSNPTYQLTSPDGKRYVLRKKPPGKLLSKTAHRVEREYRILAALAASTDVPVPRPYCLCEDASVLGTAFYVMSFLDGRIIEDPAMPDVTSPEARRAMWTDAVRTLARLHRVDPHAVGLGDYGPSSSPSDRSGEGRGGGGGGGRKQGGFYARQVSTWRTICAAQAAARDTDTGEPVGQLPHFDDMMAFFADAARQPAGRATLIHGDYKIDNLVFHKTEPRVIGILDWEMSTIGHPLSDLANLMNPYLTAALDPARVHAHKGFLPGATPGLPTMSEVASLYFSFVSSPSIAPSPSSLPSLSSSEPAHYPSQSETTADQARDLQWAQAFSMFRQAAICQGIAARVATRQASSAQARRYADARAPLAEFAWELVREIAGAGGHSSSGSEGKPRL
ncbi:hypothetical protein VTK73DRAFT_2802 [Phialemonium thermophilum]|uniref:Aminoglycoside phosphotransferase domain-containing protein n=1 Tax=Phialemonium thermophilum TaxID=223376 RepID=A0ABR3X3I3_9PEZI